MGKILASYLVRVTLRERDGETAEPDVPTNERVEELVSQALYEGTEYFQIDDIKASSERLDR